MPSVPQMIRLVTRKKQIQQYIVEKDYALSYLLDAINGRLHRKVQGPSQSYAKWSEEQIEKAGNSAAVNQEELYASE